MSTLLLLTLAYMAVAATIYGALLRLHKPKETFGSVFLDLTMSLGWGLAGPVLAGDALMGWWLGRTKPTLATAEMLRPRDLVFAEHRRSGYQPIGAVAYGIPVQRGNA